MTSLKPQHFYSPGKLLLTGEYVVLDGAISLAVPTKLGQTLSISPIFDEVLRWKSLDVNNKIWFEADFTLNAHLNVSTTSTNPIALRLVEILQVLCDLNDHFKENFKGIEAITKLEFPNNWGLGSSSTLINNLASWAHIDAFRVR
jgi:mevalonate kinase